jgi:hypothetical protein
MRSQFAVVCKQAGFTCQKLRFGGRYGLQHYTGAITLHPNTFKQRIGQYLLQEINIKVENEEISMIWGSKNDFRECTLAWALAGSRAARANFRAPPDTGFARDPMIGR